ncbi:MAG: prenyltransferase/squalene oxidase repeat-containing protein [Akkermansiaceae bacterium]
MKRLFIAALSLALPFSLQAQDGALLSLKLEMQESIKKGNAFLLSKQHKDGYWGNHEFPAFTALAVRSLLSDPSYDTKKPMPENYLKALDWIKSQQKEDGGIYSIGLATYNTSTSIMAFMTADPMKYKETILKARAFLISQQTDWGVKGKLDSEFDGGIGYGGSYDHSDLSNTHLALEALYHSRTIATDTGTTKQPELDWSAALEFISKCQNLKATNKIEKSGNDGSFVYFPGNSKAGEQVDKDGKVSLRGYGSMSYAGLLSLIYSDLTEDDPRVKTVIEWLSKNYTLKENPGLGGQGLYYYYNVMAKTLAAAGKPTLQGTDGLKIHWREQLGAKILSSQREDGSWINTTASRWMENDPILVTSYAVMAMEQIHATIPK